MDLAANGVASASAAASWRCADPSERHAHGARRLPAAGACAGGRTARSGARAVLDAGARPGRGTREVDVEAIVNGRPVAARSGSRRTASLRDVGFEVPIERSSWVALRIRGSAHTNPIFVIVGGPADSRVAPQRRVVPGGGRSVLVAEGAADPGARARRGAAAPTTTRDSAIARSWRSRTPTDGATDRLGLCRITAVMDGPAATGTRPSVLRERDGLAPEPGAEDAARDATAGLVHLRSERKIGEGALLDPHFNRALRVNPVVCGGWVELSGAERAVK